MEHTSSYTAHSPFLDSASSMGRYGDEIKLVLFGFLHYGFSYVWIGFNRAGDSEIQVCQITTFSSIPLKNNSAISQVNHRIRNKSHEILTKKRFKIKIRDSIRG